MDIPELLAAADSGFFSIGLEIAQPVTSMSRLKTTT
jgi:hypothetical protein